MTLQSLLALIFTVFISIGFVAVVILLGWFLIWKAFLSKFRLVRELLGQGEADEQQQRVAGDFNQGEIQSHVKTRKSRKD